LRLGDTGVLPTDAAVTFYDDTTLNLISDGTPGVDMPFINTIAINNLNLNGTTYVDLDVDLASAAADNFIGTTLANTGGTLNIRSLLLWSDMTNLNAPVNIAIADDPTLMSAIVLNESQSKVFGPVYAYNASYGDGFLTFKYAPDSYNPSIFIGQVAAQEGYLTQLRAYDQAFMNFGSVAADWRKECTSCGVWARPYGYRSKVDFDNGPNVTTNGWGVYGGFDTQMFDTGAGWMHNFSIYMGYNNALAKYNDVRVEQQGGVGGISLGLYKDRFFTFLTVNAGGMHNKGKGSHGRESFNLQTMGTAARIGYDIPFKCKHHIQPILNASFTYINTENYTNAAGVYMRSKRFTPVQIAPELRYIGDIKYNVQVNANVMGVWTLNGRTQFDAGDTALPRLSVDPYIQYGVGIQKKMTDDFSIGFDLYGKSLGVKEVGGVLTFKWDLGLCSWLSRAI
jgi:hypothetical protein